MVKFISIFKDAIKNIISNKLRSSLTALGLIIGITSVILLVGIGEGATSNVRSNVQSLGTGTLTVSVTSDDYTVSSQDSMRETAQTIQNTLSLLLGGIAGISLIVGGIGVMNVMLVSVTERTKEIGIRKALGAKRKDILVQFLIEALILCMLGGIIGVILGISAGLVLQTFGFNFSAKSGIILIAFASSLFIGVVFGIFPAYKASKLNPIEALRTE